MINWGDRREQLDRVINLETNKVEECLQVRISLVTSLSKANLECLILPMLLNVHVRNFLSIKQHYKSAIGICWSFH